MVCEPTLGHGATAARVFSGCGETTPLWGRQDALVLSPLRCRAADPTFFLRVETAKGPGLSANERFPVDLQHMAVTCQSLSLNPQHNPTLCLDSHYMPRHPARLQQGT